MAAKKYNITENENYIPKRITELRLERNISEYQLSLELGQSRGYINAISSGKCLPSIQQLYNIADYFDMTLSEFFDVEKTYSPSVCKAARLMDSLDEHDAELILAIIQRMAELSGKVSEIHET